MTLGVVALAVALGLDGLVGEPPERVHPVAWFGRAVAPVDAEWRRPRLVGSTVAVALPGLAALAIGTLVFVVGGDRPLAAAGLAGFGLFVSTSLRRLLERTGEVVTLSKRDPAAARERLRALAGRDASDLTPGQVRSAAVESLAENLADGLVAPLVAYTAVFVATTLAGAGPVVALAAGAGGAAWVKAVNTLDSMLGYRDTPVGWAPARLDDAVMWLPARLSALVLAVVARSPGALVAAARWTDAVPSPNSGWPMGTLAAALAVRLEKPGVYVLNPDRSLPDAGTARVAVRQVAVAGLLAYVLAGVVTWS
ncbi:MAG: adenosylcobinamide-phosphate synthase [Haloarculaceae archaeon]|jgi:adenosylcobinamide-phosphate synthase